MKCEICREREATISMRQEANGESRELHICQQCAAQNRDVVASSFPLADLLFGVAGTEIAKMAVPRGRSCTSCGMSRQEFKKHERLGCPACYETHAGEVRAMISDMQRSDRHVGKVPTSRVAAVALTSLEKELAAAVSAECYEEAAVLRDRIIELKGVSS